MKSYQDEFSDFKKEAASDYFKMQMKEEETRKKVYFSCFLLMIFLPLLIVSYRNFKRFENINKNKLRVLEDQIEIQEFASKLVLDSDFLYSLKFKNNVAKVYIADFYKTGKLEKAYFDSEYTHQCLGYFLVSKKNNEYRIYTNDYCKMDE